MKRFLLFSNIFVFVVSFLIFYICIIAAEYGLFLECVVTPNGSAYMKDVLFNEVYEVGQYPYFRVHAVIISIILSMISTTAIKNTIVD